MIILNKAQVSSNMSAKNGTMLLYLSNEQISIIS
jgi:hypothetical protein